MLIAQLTDTHVTRAGGGRRFMGDTLAHVAHAVDWIAALDPAPDAVVVTGDLGDRGEAVEYERLAGVLARLRQPYYVMRGNHDRAGPLRTAFAGRVALPAEGRLNYVADDHPVRIVALDSAEAGRAGGVADDATLAWLERTLSVDARPTVLCLHHPPFRTGMHYMDAFGFTGLRRLRALIARNEHVRLVLSGHVHRAFRTTLARATLWTSVSTAPQIVPEIFERHLFRLRFEPPGLSLHAWDGAAGSFASRLYAAAKEGGYKEDAAAIDEPPHSS